MSAVGDYEFQELVIGPYAGAAHTNDPIGTPYEGDVVAPEGKRIVTHSTTVSTPTDPSIPVGKNTVWLHSDGSALHWRFVPAEQETVGYLYIQIAFARLGTCDV